jgi:RNA polymerase sigma factor (TIGR02999 family)
MGASGEKSEITQLLQSWSRGDEHALNRIAPLIYDDLRQLARRAMSHERPGLTMQATALVNEVFLRLTEGAKVDWKDRSHFFAVASKVMRRILTDAARARRREKRGGGDEPARLEEAQVAADQNDRSLIALDDALNSLAKSEPRKVRVVEMRFFGGMTHDEIAAVLTVSRDTVKRDWNFAKLWLAREIRGDLAFG